MFQSFIGEPYFRLRLGVRLLSLIDHLRDLASTKVKLYPCSFVHGRVGHLALSEVLIAVTEPL